MNRKDFIQYLGMSAVIGLPSSALQASSPCHSSKRIIPQRLLEGQTVSLIAPAGPISEEKYQKALRNLENLGLKVKPGKHLRQINGFLAGTDAERLADLHEAFTDPDTAAVWCVRGGYGCTRILENISYKLIKANPKPLIGYSDITALQVALALRIGLVSFHAPLAASDYNAESIQQLKDILFVPKDRPTIQLSKADTSLADTAYTPHIIHAGKAQGRTLGGNISVLAAMAGTAFAPDFKGKIAILEDIGEEPYRIDRMLTQLLQSTNLRQAAGIALGVFVNCEPKPDNTNTWTLRQTLHDRLGALGIPVAYGFPFGHIPNLYTIPINVQAALDTESGSLTFLEKAVK